MKTLFFTLIFVICIPISQSEYSKTYYSNGKMKEEGWLIDNKKNNYWFFYYENGTKKQEGHFNKGQKINWWIYYDSQERIIKKCEYKNNVLNGLTIVYDGGEIIGAEKYVMGKKINSWNTLADFKKDNP